MNDVNDFLCRALSPQTSQNREQLVHGIVTARVVQAEGDGTYRLRIHGMNGQPDDVLSAPARVAMPMAGKGRGMHFFPEPDDEVVVAFLVGDTNQPIIIGAVWNRDSPPPDQAHESADNDVRTIVSRSGHEVTLDDSPGREKVTVRTQGGHELVLDDAPSGLQVTLSTKGGRRLVLSDGGAGGATLETQTTQLTISDAGGSVSLQSMGTLTLEAPVIRLDATQILIGSAVSATIIDHIPFKLHTHGTPPTVGPVVTPVP